MSIKITRKNNLNVPKTATYKEKLTVRKLLIRFAFSLLFCIGLMFLWAFVESLHVDENSNVAVKFLKSADTVRSPIETMQKKIDNTVVAMETKDREYRDIIESKNRELSVYVSRGSDRKTKPLLDYSKLQCPRYLVELMERMSAVHGFPTIATVYCIAKYESNYDPSCWTKTGEDSRGLLQVNVGDSSHAKRNANKTKLFDPAYNLDYQLDELKIYYDKGMEKGLSGADLIIYTAREGQRPQWKEWISESIRKSYKEYLSSVVKE